MLDEIYKAMADPHRREILSSLSERPRVAGELARIVQLAPNALSFHLKWLRSAGLVSMRREGRFLRYAANPSAIGQWQAHVSAAFRPERQALHPFAPVAASSAPTAPASAQLASQGDSPLPDDADALPTELL